MKTIKAKQKLNTYFKHDRICRVELRNAPHYFVELNASFYDKIKYPKSFDLNQFTPESQQDLLHEAIFIGDLVQECREQNSVGDKFIDVLKDLFFKCTAEIEKQQMGYSFS